MKEKQKLAESIANAIFKAGDNGSNKCQRIAFKGGVYPDGETNNGGMCRWALTKEIAKALEVGRKEGV